MAENMDAILVRRCVKYKNVVTKVQAGFTIQNFTIMVQVRTNKKQLFIISNEIFLFKVIIYIYIYYINLIK